jgi:uncharacterized protein YdiU (UPF0061 family)
MALLTRLETNQVDYTVFFRTLCAAVDSPAADHEVAALFSDPTGFYEWASSWRARLARDGSAAPGERARAMRGANPAFIPRNHRIEQAIVAGQAGDFAPFDTLVRVLQHPYDDQPEAAHLAEPPLAEERVAATFCGT